MFFWFSSLLIDKKFQSVANIIDDGAVKTIDFTKLYTEELNARNNALNKMKEEFKEEIEDEGRRASRIGTNIGQNLKFFSYND